MTMNPRKNDKGPWKGPRKTGHAKPMPSARPAPYRKTSRFEEPAPQQPADGQAPYERPHRHVDLPLGIGAVHLKSASYGAFIYQRMIDRIEGKVEDGDLVAVIDKRGSFFGWGFYNSQSPLGLRMFSHDTAMPTDEKIALRVARAVGLRRNLLHLDDTTNAYRLIHAEGDGLSGLIADRYDEFVVIELFSLAMYRRLDLIRDAIVDAGLSVKSFVVRADKSVAEQEGFKISTLTDVDRKNRQAVIEENGVKFAVRLATGHKTGFFCDQRENRLALTSITPGLEVLDVCCYTGGFSCYAATLGKARNVTAVDLDEVALETAAQNAELNQARIEFTHADAFDYLRRANAQGQQWDVVIVDPSKFVSRRDLIDVGLRKYNDLNRLAAGVVRKGGLMLTCSCSGLVDQNLFMQTVTRAARSAGRTLQILRQSGAGPDHPFMADTPEGSYLKAIWARLD